MPTRRKSALAVRPIPAEAPVTKELEQLGFNQFLADLPAREANRVLAETQAFLSARLQGQRSYLEMGRHLEQVQEILEPMGKFLGYVACIPNLSQATSYRMIWAWQNARRVLPEATLEAAMLQGYKLISWQKGGDFTPQYKKAISKVEREMGPPPAHNMTQAHKWLARLAEVKREMSPKTRIFDMEKAQISLIRAFQRFLDRLPRPERHEGAKSLLGRLVKIAGIPVAQIRPLGLPRTFTMPKRGRPREDVEEDLKMRRRAA